MLVRLMYASRAVPATSQDTLLAILRKSKADNPALGVTGVLCFSEGIFLQVLEGGRSAVNRLYNRMRPPRSTPTRSPAPPRWPCSKNWWPPPPSSASRSGRSGHGALTRPLRRRGPGLGVFPAPVDFAIPYICRC